MSTLMRDLNRVPTRVRQGNPLAGCLELDDSLSANTWYRLMPHGNAGALVDDNDRKLNIGTLRSDVLEIEQWNMVILNEGYKQYLRVVNHEGQEVEFDQPIEYIEGIKSANIQSSIQFVLYPLLLIPFSVTNDEASDGRVELGVTTDDDYTPSTIKKLGSVRAGRVMMIPFSRVDRLFYRLPTALTSSQTAELCWGEHYITR